MTFCRNGKVNYFVVKLLSSDSSRYVIRTSEQKTQLYHSEALAHKYSIPRNREQMLYLHCFNNSNFMANVQTVWLPLAIRNLIVLTYMMTSFREISPKEGCIFQVDFNKPIALNQFLPYSGSYYRMLRSL